MAIDLPITISNYKVNMEALISKTEYTQSDVLFWQWQWKYDVVGYIEWLNNMFNGGSSGESEKDTNEEPPQEWTSEFEYEGSPDYGQGSEEEFYDFESEHGEPEKEIEPHENTWLFSKGIHGNDVKTNFNIDLNLMKEHISWIKELSNNLGSSLEYSSEKITTKKLVTYRSQSTSMLSNDLPDVHPDQFGFLEDPELEEIFLLAFSERKLYQTGIKTKYIDEESINETSTKKGPLIICLDTSASMYWSNSLIPIDIGKMMIFELVMHAANDGREVIMIEFANRVRYFNLINIEEQYDDFLEFWRNVKSGGTDVEYAIEYAIDKVNKKGIMDADILAVSDMQIDYTQRFVNTINKAKESGMSLYGINIGDYIHQSDCSQEDIFDHVFTLTSKSDTGKLHQEIKSYFNN